MIDAIVAGALQHVGAGEERLWSASLEFLGVDPALPGHVTSLD
jgi:hypothetical protein